MMLTAFGHVLGTPLQGGIFATLLAIFGLALRVWILGIPERLRVKNETRVLEHEEVALRLREFRIEVHALRNELGMVRAELHSTQNQSARRGDKLNMVLFILRMVMDELSSKDGGNKVLAQAKRLLSGIDDEPGKDSHSVVMNAALHSEEAAAEAVREVAASEAKDVE